MLCCQFDIKMQLYVRAWVLFQFDDVGVLLIGLFLLWHLSNLAQYIIQLKQIYSNLADWLREWMTRLQSFNISTTLWIVSEEKYNVQFSWFPPFFFFSQRITSFDIRLCTRTSHLLSFKFWYKKQNWHCWKINAIPHGFFFLQTFAP